MPAGVGEPQRVVQRVRVAVEGLGAGRIRDQRVGLGEAGDGRGGDDARERMGA